MTAIAMIGLGNMGGRMGSRLVEAGHDVHGFDIAAERAVQLGFTAAASPAAATSAAEIVLLSLPSDAAIATAMAGPEGVLSAVREGQLVVDLSTATPSVAPRWESELAAKGAQFLDAGISGGPVGADKGTLTLMVGGEASALERVREIFGVIGSQVYHCGAAGAGHATKAVNNYLNGMNLAATAEAMVVGVKAGLDPRQLLEVINASTGANWASANRFPRIVEGDYIEGGLSNALMAKDLNIFMAMADQLDVPAMLGATCRATFGVAMATGYRDKVSNTVVDAIGDLAGGVRIQPDNKGNQA